MKLDPTLVLLTWRITTRQALKASVVPRFLAALRQALPGSTYDEDAVTTALHEAVANAAIHGNLGLAASPRRGLNAADALSRHIEARLRNSARADLPLVITAARRQESLVLSVIDGGAGFAAEGNRSAEADASHGRGLILMRAMAASVEFRRGGREVCLTFPLLSEPCGDTAACAQDAHRSDLTGARILIADDSETQRQMIGHCLNEAGYTAISYAADGNAALAQCAAFEPDLILLDLAMPWMDGIEACRILNTRYHGSVPIVIQSVTQTPHERVRAFEAGAVDFIVKPFYPPELVSRVQTHLRTRQLLRELHGFRARLGDELNAARLMQESLIPSSDTLAALRHTMGLDIAAHCEMSSELGGDIWGLRMIDAHRIGLFIADFAGHGVASAANAFRLHAVLGESGIRFERPDLVMQALNVRLAGALNVGNFATLFYGVLDTASDQLAYTAAGAPGPVLMMPDGQVSAIDTTGVPVGVKPWHEYEVRTIGFPPGAGLFLYSDALLESPDTANRTWGEASLLDWLGKCRAPSAADSIASLLDAFNADRRRPLPDDLTLVALRRIIETVSRVRA